MGIVVSAVASVLYPAAPATASDTLAKSTQPPDATQQLETVRQQPHTTVTSCMVAAPSLPSIPIIVHPRSCSQRPHVVQRRSATHQQQRKATAASQHRPQATTSSPAIMPLLRLFPLLLASALLCLVPCPAAAGRMRFLAATTPYTYAPVPAPVQTIAPVSTGPITSLAPTPAPVSNQPTQVPASPSPTQSGYVSPTQCPGQFTCAPAGGVSAFNGSFIQPQGYPYGTFVDGNGAAVNLTAPCIPLGNDAVALHCPVQYDAPESHGAGVQDNVCYVYDPYRAEQPWALSSSAYAQCYNPVEYACTATNFLCPITAPYACGRACFNPQQYKCQVNFQNFFQSTLLQHAGAVPTQYIYPAQPKNQGC